MYLDEKKEYKVTELNNGTIEVMHSNSRQHKINRGNKGSPIKKISKTQYLVKSTGEIKDYKSKDDKVKDDAGNVRRTLTKLRQIIEYNTDKEKSLFITLTYADDIKDTNKMQKDFEKFIFDLRKLFAKEQIKIEYIMIPEPQQRGTWHIHLIIIGDRSLYVDNKVVTKIWKKGQTKTEKIRNVRKLAHYLTAYVIGDNKVKKCKLVDYPKGMRLYRRSSGIKTPPAYYLNGEAVKGLLKNKCAVWEKRYSKRTPSGYNVEIDRAIYKEIDDDIN